MLVIDFSSAERHQPSTWGLVAPWQLVVGAERVLVHPVPVVTFAATARQYVYAATARQYVYDAMKRG